MILGVLENFQFDLFSILTRPFVFIIFWDKLDKLMYNGKIQYFLFIYLLLSLYNLFFIIF